MVSEPSMRVVRVDVGALESRQLSPAQPAEAGEQDQRPVTPIDRIGQGVDLARARPEARPEMRAANFT